MNDLLSFTVELSPGQVEQIATRVAAILADRSAPAPPPGAFVTVAEAAALLGVRPKTVANYLSSGRLTRHGGPRRPLVARAEVEAFASGGGRERPAEHTPRRRRRPRHAGPTFTDRARRADY